MRSMSHKAERTVCWGWCSAAARWWRAGVAGDTWRSADRSAVGACCGTLLFFFFSSRRRHTRLQGDWSSDVCSSDLVARHRAEVPEAFAQRISLAAHQKAADYTLAKARIALIEMTLGAVVLLAWTLLGGLDALNQWLLELMGAGLWQQLALLAGFALISGLVELPLSLYQTFVLEQRFGFNQMTLRLWLTDAIKSTAMGAAIGLPLAALILWLMGSAGDLWWLWAWAVWTAFNLLLMWIFPTDRKSVV